MNKGHIKNYQKTINEFKKQCIKTFDKKILSLILFGSFIRGDISPGFSDVDLLIVLKKTKGEDYLKLAKIKKKIYEKYKVTIGLTVLTENEFVSNNTIEAFVPYMDFFINPSSFKVLYGKNLVFKGKKNYSFYGFVKQVASIPKVLRDLGVARGHMESKMMKLHSTVLAEKGIYYSLRIARLFLLLDNVEVFNYPDLMKSFSKKYPKLGKELAYFYNLRNNWNKHNLSKKELFMIYFKAVKFVEKIYDMFLTRISKRENNLPKFI